MRIAIIGRTEILFETARQLAAAGHEIACVITAREAPEYTRTAADFAQLATQYGAPFFATPDILSLRDAIAALPAMDIGVSLNYSGIIPQAIIDCFRLGILNAHGGDLPRYRGNACQAWAILNGEEKIGLCIHRMIGGELDNGDIVARDYLPITHDTKVTEAWEWMGARIPPLFAEAVAALGEDASYILERQSKDPAAALRCYPRKPEDGAIHWAQPALAILRLINACTKPYAGAFALYNGEKLTIWDAALEDDGERFLAIPGQVTAIEPGSVVVATGGGKLRLRSVAYAGETSTPDRLITSLRTRLDDGRP